MGGTEDIDLSRISGWLVLYLDHMGYAAAFVYPRRCTEDELFEFLQNNSTDPLHYEELYVDVSEEQKLEWGDEMLGLPRTSVCDRCCGLKWESGTGLRCPACDGTGKFVHWSRIRCEALLSWYCGRQLPRRHDGIGTGFTVPPWKESDNED